MSNILFDSYPLIVDRALAEMLGLEKAVILQQIHYWLQKKNKSNYHDGHYWVYNTVKNWRDEQFRFIKSEKTLSKYLKELEADGILLTGNYNKMKFDRTKWYTIDYEVLKARHYAFGKKGEMEVPQNTERNNHELPNGTTTNYRYNTKDYTKTTTKTTKDNTSGKPDNAPYAEIISYLNEKANTKYRASTKETKRLIKARFNEGFNVEDFKKVIDIKCSKWLNDSKMKDYLRPSTLFGTKFESYLNEKPKRVVGLQDGTSLNDVFGF